MQKIIKGVGVQLDHPDVAKCKTVSDVEALDIFSHLNDSEKEAASQELLNLLNTPDVEFQLPKLESTELED